MPVPSRSAAKLGHGDLMMLRREGLAAQRDIPQADVAAIGAPVARLVEGFAASALPHAVAGRGVDHYTPLLSCPVHECLLRIHLHGWNNG